MSTKIKQAEKKTGPIKREERRSRCLKDPLEDKENSLVRSPQRVDAPDLCPCALAMLLPTLVAHVTVHYSHCPKLDVEPDGSGLRF